MGMSWDNKAGWLLGVGVTWGIMIANERPVGR